jgi:SsrA-binding protein
LEKALSINIRNKRASFEFHLLDKFTAGIVLSGTEIKSIRLGKASISEAYCYLVNQEIWVKNMDISEYAQGNRFNHLSKRERKLLLNKKEIKKIEGKLTDKGITLIPLHLYISESGYAKLEISLAKGKKLYDKRESLKLKDTQRDLQRKLK